MKKQTAIFAAGCFWGVEEAFRMLPGVIDTTVGYTGGHIENPTYEQVCTKGTGHAEAVKVEFDPGEISYQDLLDVFWKSHDPTQLNRQGADVGDQYRSAIFVLTDEQRKVAEASKAELAASGIWKKPIVTEITDATDFYDAEDYHQEYFKKRGGETCHV